MTLLDTMIVAPLTHVGEAPLRPAASKAGAVDPDLAPLLSVLLHTMDETRSLVVNIAAAHPGAGTSTIARRLAEAAGATGWCRVALLDAQPGRGDRRAEEGPGLIELVERGDHPLLLPAMLGGSAVDTGRLSTAGHPLSRIDSVRRLYGILRDRYSLVIVDCPAVLGGPQTLTIAAAADETVLVLEAEQTALHDVARARAALERRGAGVLGLVMNKKRRAFKLPLGRRR